MSVDALWPNIADPLHITAADHAAHTTHKSDFFIDKSHKYGKPLLKMASKGIRARMPHRKKK